MFDHLNPCFPRNRGEDNSMIDDPFTPIPVAILENLGVVHMGRAVGFMGKRRQVLQASFDLHIVQVPGMIEPVFGWNARDSQLGGHILSGPWIEDRSWKSLSIRGQFFESALKRSDRKPRELRKMRVVFSSPEDPDRGLSRAAIALQALDSWSLAGINRSKLQEITADPPLGFLLAKPLVVLFVTPK